MGVGRLSVVCAVLMAIGGCASPAPREPGQAAGDARAQAKQLLTEAESLSRAGEWNAALGKLQDAEQLTPDDPGVQIGLGICLLQLKRSDEALAHLERVLVLAPQHPKRYVALGLIGMLRMERKEPDAAIAAFEQLLELKPNDKGAIATLAEIHCQRGDRLPCASRIEQFRSVVANEDARLWSDKDRASIRATLDRMSVYETQLQQAGPSQ
jgi:Flp pilus assembly protein TadD